MDKSSTSIISSYSHDYPSGETMEKGTFMIHIDPEKDNQLTMLAAQLNRPKNELVSQAIENFLEVQNWQMEQTRLAMQEADFGLYATDEELDEIENQYKPS
jgi:predicted transcriptional regulator